MEDGTGEAQLYVYDDMVSTVLKLSGQQWRHLQDLAMRTGELLYQRHWRGGSSRPQVQFTASMTRSNGWVFLIVLYKDYQPAFNNNNHDRKSLEIC